MIGFNIQRYGSDNHPAFLNFVKSLYPLFQINHKLTIYSNTHLNWKIIEDNFTQYGATINQERTFVEFQTKEQLAHFLMVWT
jgi:hypothetical protein